MCIFLLILYGFWAVNPAEIKESMTLPNLIISKRTYIKPEIFLEDILEEQGVMQVSDPYVNKEDTDDKSGDGDLGRDAKGMKFGLDWSNWEE